VNGATVHSAVRLALYQRFAEEAVKFALHAPTMEQRLDRLKIARAWAELADQAVKQGTGPS
jgi:hypothetical protein